MAVKIALPHADIDWDKDIPILEETVAANPHANTGDALVADLLPFVRTVRPKISNFNDYDRSKDITFIYLQDGNINKDRIISDGLQPLFRAGVLSAGEANAITGYLKCPDGPALVKKIYLGGVAYELIASTEESYKSFGARVLVQGDDLFRYPRGCLAAGCGNIDAHGRCEYVPACGLVTSKPSP
jgi:hypothetical protein